MLRTSSYFVNECSVYSRELPLRTVRRWLDLGLGLHRGEATIEGLGGSLPDLGINLAFCITKELNILASHNKLGSSLEKSGLGAYFTYRKY